MKTYCYLANLLFCTFTLHFAQTAEQLVDHALYPPGQVIDIGGHRLHINCQGQARGQPSIILESGAGGFSLEWVNIQKALSPFTRICAYDRAGYGWSDMGPLPRTSKRIVGELHTLLEKAAVAGPYILVGHSFGGYTAQYFASHYPQETAGLLLIDSSHPEQAQRLPKAAVLQQEQLPALSRTYSVGRPVLHEHYPQDSSEGAYRLMSSWRYRAIREEELLSMPQSARQLVAAGALPPVPLVVLSRGRRVWPHTAYGDEMEKTWMQLQDELSLLAEGSVHLIAERSGHAIHLDQPELVISALRLLLDE